MILRSSRRGATLPEVLTASAIFLMMLGGLISVGSEASVGWANGASRVMADDSASSAIQVMTSEVRAGLRLTVNAAGTEATVVMPYVNAQGDYDRFTDGGSVRYYASSGKLYRQVGTTGPTVLSRNVARARFEDAGGRLQIEIVSERHNGNRSATTTLTTQIALRNDPI